jgi:peptidoglycan hydrolase FlgJ
MADDLPIYKPPAPPLDLTAKPTGNLLGSKKATVEEAGKAAEDFEAVFISQMLAPMFAGIESDSTFGGGSAEDTYRGMLTNEYGKLISKAGGLGIADAVKSELIRAQEKKI